MNRTRPRVLIVEDDQHTCDLLGQLLLTLDWDSVPATTVAEAIERLAIVFDLVILDLMLPDGDGVRVLSEIRERKIVAPVIVSSGKDRGADFSEVIALKPDQLLEKPVSWPVIKAMAIDIRDRFHADRGAKP